MECGLRLSLRSGANRDWATTVCASTERAPPKSTRRACTQSTLSGLVWSAPNGEERQQQNKKHTQSLYKYIYISERKLERRVAGERLSTGRAWLPVVIHPLQPTGVDVIGHDALAPLAAFLFNSSRPFFFLFLSFGIVGLAPRLLVLLLQFLSLSPLLLLLLLFLS